MGLVGVEVAFDPGTSGAALAFVAAGATLGTVSGLTPGLHANNFALLLASVAATIPGPPQLVAAAMLAAGVVHTFLDIVPALAFGVPDAALAITALPGHRLVIAGRGREALRLSALGSALAILLAVPLATPITAGMTAAYPLVREHTSIVLGAIVAFMLATERSRRARVGAGVAFLASAALGWVALDVAPDAPLDAGGMLAPLFAGLFGAPVLLEAMGGQGVPKQDDAAIVLPRRTILLTATGGAVAGAIVAYLPGVSSAIAAVIALVALPAGARGVAVESHDEARKFVVASSGVNTANTVFALFALVALGTPRTGVTVAIERASLPLNVPLLLASVVIAAAIGVCLVVLIGDRYLRVVGRRDPTLVSIAVLALLVFVSYLFAGAIGVLAFGVATVVGCIPPRSGAQRVHLMGVLLGPLIAW